LNSLLCEFHPARERLVFRKYFSREFIRARNVSSLATQRNPAERSSTFAKKRADVFENKSWNVERILDSGLFCLCTDIVSVIKCDGAIFLQHEHGFHVH